MPTTHFRRYDLAAVQLNPAFNPESARELGVNLAEGTYVKGTMLGELTATPGTFAAYNAAGVDGSEVPMRILKYSCVVDEDGNIQLGDGSFNEFPSNTKVIDSYYCGTFLTQDIVDLDATALEALGGRLVAGDFDNGIFKF